MGVPRPIHESVNAQYKEYSSVRQIRSSIPKGGRGSRVQTVRNARYTTIPKKPKGTKGVTQRIRAKKRFRRALRSGFIASSWLMWFYPIQLFFAIFFVIAMGAAGSDGFIAWLTEDIALAVMMLSWILLIALGIGFMLYTILVLSIYRVKLWSDPKTLLVFGVCLWGYWAPYFFFFPWFILFILYVAYAQRHSS